MEIKLTKTNNNQPTTTSEQTCLTFSAAALNAMRAQSHRFECHSNDMS
jgi:hypothetical protein